MNTELTDAECDALIRQAFPLTKASAAYRKLVRLAARSADTSGASPHWDEGRHDDLKALQRLIREVGSINTGSHCLERIARCIELAETLDRSDYRTGRMTFLNFLTELAIAEPPPAAPGGPAGARRPDENSPSGPSDRALNPQPEAVDRDRGAR